MVQWKHLTNLGFGQILSPSIIVIILSLAIFPFVNSAFADVPVGFSDTLIASGFNLPTAIEVAPDGRIFVSEKKW